MKRNIIKLLVLGLFVVGLAACEKEESKNSSRVDMPDALVLDEGNMGSNNAGVSALDISGAKIDNEWFENNFRRSLGDQAQDIILNGDNVYITVTESNTIEMINTADGTVNQKSMGSLKPRSLAADGNKLYVSCYNPPCVVRLNANTLNIEDTCLLGEYRPEGIAVAKGKLFVAGAYHKVDYFYYDDKVYVIDLATFDALPSVTAGSNNNKVKKINDDKLIFTHGNGTPDSPTGAFILDANDYSITTVNVGLTKMAVYGGKVYGYNAPYGGSPTFVVVNADGSSEPFPFTPVFDGLETNENPYGISVNPANGDIYFTTDGAYRVPGYVFCFKPDGSLCFKLKAGMLPSDVLFIK